MADDSPKPSKGSDFAAGATDKNAGLLAELFDFLKTNKKWWLLPIVVVLLLVGVLVVLGGSVAAPFIYTLF
jgi:Family of unknown function (DUF5989)